MAVTQKLTRDLVSIDVNEVYVPDTQVHLNATRFPDDPLAGSDWSYLTTDGSSDGPYLDAEEVV